MTAKLRPGSIIIDLIAGGIYGDPGHNPKEDLLESAEALLSLLPKVQHTGLWGLGKAFDSDCYLYTAARKYQAPDGISLPTNIDKGPVRGDPEALRRIPDRPFTLIVFDGSNREEYWRREWHYKRVGSVKDGHATPDIEGVPERYREPEQVISTLSSRTTVTSRPSKPKEPVTAQPRLF